MAVPQPYVALDELNLTTDLSPGETGSFDDVFEDVEAYLASVEWRATPSPQLQDIIIPCKSQADFSDDQIPFVAFSPKQPGRDTVPASPQHSSSEKSRQASSESRTSGGVQQTTLAGETAASVPTTGEFDRMNHDHIQHFPSRIGTFSNQIFMATITDNERHLLEELMPGGTPGERVPEALTRTTRTSPRFVLYNNHKLRSTSPDCAGHSSTLVGTPERVWHFQEDSIQVKLAIGSPG